MAHPDDLAFYLECGCEIMDSTLGFQRMPDGYHLMLNADRSHFFWFEKATGRESAIHWNKWAVFHWAKFDAREKEGQQQ